MINVRGRGAGAIETDVPSSITQFDASTIEALGAQDISDLSRVTPNVNIVQPGATQATFFVRGVGLSDFSSNAAGAVTIFQDDVALNAPAIQTGQLYDVEGIDVVRGPQGSGPFRNASAGAIRVRSRRPTGNYTATAPLEPRPLRHEGRQGREGNALIQDYEGALEVPIVEESLSSRFAFRLREADPYRTNGCGYALPFDQRLHRRSRRQPARPVTSASPSRLRASASAGNAANRGPSARRNIQGSVWSPEGRERRAQLGRARDAPLPAARHGAGVLSERPRQPARPELGARAGDRHEPSAGAVFGSDIRFAGTDDAGYVDRDVQEEFDELCEDTDPVADGANCAQSSRAPELAKRLAEDRPLDKRPYRGDYDRVGQTTRDTWGGFVSGEVPLFADTKLFALASYDQYERFQDQDTDFTPELLFEAVQGDEAWQTYDELRLDGELEAEPVQWQLGGYYLREELDNDTTVFVFRDDDPDVVINTRRIYTQTIDSFAAWGEFGWDFADDFTLEGGVRWNWERKRFDFLKIGGRLQGRSAGAVVRARGSTWETPTGQIILTYHIDADKAAYARYTRGFKAGHFNALASADRGRRLSRDLRRSMPPADEEYNDAWEAGLRGTWLDRRLSLAGSFFYYRYENYQIFLFTDSADPAEPPVLEIVNAKQAENFGVELEGALQPLEGWAPRLLSGLRLSANFSWLHGEYLNFTTFRKFASSDNQVFNASIDYSGKQLQNAPSTR